MFQWIPSILHATDLAYIVALNALMIYDSNESRIILVTSNVVMSLKFSPKNKAPYHK